MRKPSKTRTTKSFKAVKAVPKQKSAEPIQKEKEEEKHTAPRLRLQVTRDQIETAIRANGGHCMIAEAIKAEVPWARAVSVDLQSIRMSDPAAGLRYIYLTPRICQDALVRFDLGRNDIPPFPFSLRAAQITSMLQPSRYRKKGKSQLRHKLGRRRFQPTKQDQELKTIPETIGGKPPLKHHSSAIKHRRFGMRGFTLEDVACDPILTNRPEA
jgi:hypothetical protein